jgi:hypothetical protein
LAVLSTENSTSGSAKNNVRPYVIPNSNNSPLRLIWMNGDYYYWIVNSSYPNGYPTSVRCDYNLYPTPATLPAPLVETLHATSFQSTNDTEILETPAISGNFTITAFIKPNSSSYSGKFFQAGDLSYNLSSRSTSSVTAARPMPNVKIASATYNSGNVFGSSDVWKNYSSTTNGSWYEPTKFDKVSLAITCKDGTLTTYINGLIDQKFDVASLTFDDVTLGGFVGEILHFAVYNTALTQNQIKLVVTDNIASLAAEEFADLQVSSVAYTDIVIPAKTPSGSMLTWTSSNPNVLSHTGLVNLPQTPTVVTLTASLGSASRQFAVTVMPRDISKNMVFKYLFDETDRYESGGASYLIDQSAKHNDARVMGNAVIDGALNLTANTNAAFSANGYLLAPDGILDSIRSYSFLMKVNLKRNDVNPRIYDFGSGSGNSVFGRANALTAGFKYNGGTTVMLNSTRQLSLNTDTYLAFTFDAKTKTTKIYMDATENSSGTAITHEPYELIASNRNYIGRTQWWSDSGQASSNTDFCGKMDDFYLFDIALAQPEIAQIQGFATGLFEIKNNKSLQIYPNPIHAGETLNFSLPEYANQNAVLQIFAVDGSMLFSQNLFLKNTLSLPIDFPHGFYFLKIQVGGQIFREKLWVVN